MEEDKTDMHFGARLTIFRNAKRLRNRMTEAEKVLWNVLKNKQLESLKFRRQHPISVYVLDFFCHKAKLGIELDGKYHDEKGQIFYDEDRTQNLQECGVRIIRFTNDEVLTNLKEVLRKIKEECLDRQSS